MYVHNFQIKLADKQLTYFDDDMDRLGLGTKTTDVRFRERSDFGLK